MVRPTPIIKQVQVVIPGSPVPQGRGRASYQGGRLRVRDPETSRVWKMKARTMMRIAMRSRKPLEGPLTVTVWFISVLARSRVGSAQWKDTLPDLDNLQKSLFDAANGVLWKDDGQVARVFAYKVVDRKNEKPRVLMSVRGLTEQELVMPVETDA